MNTTLRFLRFLPAIVLLFVWGCEMEENEIKDLEEQVSTDVLVMDYNARRPTIDPTPGKLIAGQKMEAGTVTVTENGDYLIITVNANADWCLTKIHMHVGDDISDIPQARNGNPKIGNFAHVMELNECTSSYSYEFMKPEDANLDGCYLVAVHAVVSEVLNNRLKEIELNIPDQVTMSVSYPSAGDPSYFETTVTGGTILDGIYDGWCIDTDNVIYQNTNYIADVYSSYEDLPSEIIGNLLIDYPENLDYVNWIINQDFVGKQSGCGGTYTYGDVQKAIWILMDNKNSNAGLGPWEMCRVEELLSAASAFGNGFIPECGDDIAVILVPRGKTQIIIAQATIISIDVECEIVTGDEETAWASGTQFKEKGGSWAMFSNSCDYTIDN